MKRKEGEPSFLCFLGKIVALAEKGACLADKSEIRLIRKQDWLINRDFGLMIAL
ncbi:hypothetical protein SFC52_09645 [Niallia circulans]|uniref:hypothetical protein n=1 Tax=Niallia circulans TaxID=1397 RepID=UPI003981F54B